AAGAEVLAVADSRDGAADQRLDDAGIDHLTGFTPVEARGRGEVSGVVVARGSERRSFRTDLVAMSGRSVGQTALLSQIGGTLRYDRDQHRYVPDHLPAGVRVVGAAAGGDRATGSLPPKSTCSSKQVVCFCEDVTTKDIALSLEEGFTSLELSKRYTTV